MKINDVNYQAETVSEIYDSVIELFKDKTRFAQGYYQKTQDGQNCARENGFCFCVLGAMDHVTSYDESGKFITSYKHDTLRNFGICLLQRVSEHLYGGQHIQNVNDSENGYNLVIKALSFASNLWKGYIPQDKHLSMSVDAILAERVAA